MVAKEDGTWEYRVCNPAYNTAKEGYVLLGTILELREEGILDDIYEMIMTVPQTDSTNANINQLQSC